MILVGIYRIFYFALVFKKRTGPPRQQVPSPKDCAASIMFSPNRPASRSPPLVGVQTQIRLGALRNMFLKFLVFYWIVEIFADATTSHNGA